MSSLADLQSGRLNSATHVKIAEGLASFPRELFQLCETLEVLDLSGNRLSSLPEDFDRFKNLRILFLSDNQFRTFPPVLGNCPQLSMVGFKANRIGEIPEGAFPPRLRWLILTDNEIAALPRSIGTNQKLQKVMLAGNRIAALPEEMANCVNIELLRLSANRLTHLPPWLTSLPKLTWLAFSGNPCSRTTDIQHDLTEVHWDELQIDCSLGEGASGVISQARWSVGGDIALKEFKGSVTSDGLPADEMAAAIAAGQHKNLVELVGRLAGHPEGKEGLLLSLIDSDFTNLAAPPSLESCTRDIYTADQRFSLPALLNIAEGIAAAALHLHQRKIMHGDLYAHNILVNQAADCLLGDFGAATQYGQLPQETHAAIERLEVRAFACLLEELLQRLHAGERAQHPLCVDQLMQLQRSCMSAHVAQRPDFASVATAIEVAAQSLTERAE